MSVLRTAAFIVLASLAAPSAAEYGVHPQVQDRLLAMIREGSLASPYSERQLQRMRGASRAPLHSAAEALRRLGAVVRLDRAAPGRHAQLLADWSGRTFPEQFVLLCADLRVESGAPGLAAAMGVIEAYKRLQLKPRRSVRIAARDGADAADCGDPAASQALRPTAAIEVGAGAGRAVGLRARLPATASAALDPLRAALRPLGAATIELRPEMIGGSILGLERLGVPGFAPLIDGSAAPAPPGELRQRVALLAALTWMLAEMAETLPPLPAVPG